MKSVDYFNMPIFFKKLAYMINMSIKYVYNENVSIFLKKIDTF